MKGHFEKKKLQDKLRKFYMDQEGKAADLEIKVKHFLLNLPTVLNKLKAVDDSKTLSQILNEKKNLETKYNKVC